MRQQGSAAAGRPTDELYPQQWHLAGGPAGLGIEAAWVSATGRGVRIAFVDDGFDRSLPDLAARVDTTRDRDFRTGDDDAAPAWGDAHGTAVAGVALASRDGQGVVGVAPDATLVGARIGYGAFGSLGQTQAALDHAWRNADVVTCAWSFDGVMTDNFRLPAYAPLGAELAEGARLGRGGLGTVWVFPAGNNAGTGDDVNHHNFQNSRFAITVAATDRDGVVAPFSTPGAAIHVSAPGVGILTTDNRATLGWTAGDTATVTGTSFAAPMVAGVAALLLQANPELGWRDVQEILALTARQTDPKHASWMVNHGDGWNGGGLHHSLSYGFGLVDPRAALRLAEAWEEGGTSATLASAGAGATPGRAIPDAGRAAFAVTLGRDIRIERVEVTLDLRHEAVGDLRIVLVSPSGTRSVLLDRPGLAPGASGHGSPVDDVDFTLSSSQFRGESSAGRWVLRVEDAVAGETGRLLSWRLVALGEAPAERDSYVYTDEYGRFGRQAGRQVLEDAGGLDTINCAAMTRLVAIDLDSGGTIAGRPVAIAAGTVIERLFGGTGRDTLSGNAADNWIRGGRGDDLLAGGGGADVFVMGRRAGADRIADFDAGDRIWLTEGIRLLGIEGSVARLSHGGTLTALDGHLWTAGDFRTVEDWL